MSKLLICGSVSSYDAWEDSSLVYIDAGVWWKLIDVLPLLVPGAAVNEVNVIMSNVTVEHHKRYMLLTPVP